ncbi:unnamed protein product, partial [Menidia menidia]
MQSLFKEGDIMIGGIFPVFHKEISRTGTFERKPPGVVCEGFDLRVFRWTQVMIFAVEEINKDSALLPNISLGYRILNSCASPTNALRAVLTLASRPEEIKQNSPCPPSISALIAESGSSQSIAVAGALGPFQVPIVIHVIGGVEEKRRDRLNDLAIEGVSSFDSSSPKCKKLGDSELPALQSEGDVVIGGIFPLHYGTLEPQHTYQSKPQITPCSGFDHRAFRWMMTMVFAIEEINHNSNILPGVHLGYRIMDCCDNVHTSLQALLSLITASNLPNNEDKQTAESENTFDLTNEKDFGKVRLNSVDLTTVMPFKVRNKSNYVNNNETEGGTITQLENSSCLFGSPISAVIGLASSSPTRAMAEALGPFNIPLVSYFATCTCLTNKHLYPSFLRTVPSDLFQVRGLVQLVTFLDWFWVGTLGTTDDYSQYGIQAFSNQFKKEGGCVAFHLTIPKSPTLRDIKQMADRLQSSTAKVVVVFATEGQLLDLFLELIQRNLTGLQWVASEAWVTASLLTSPHFHPLLEGTLGFSFPGARIPGLKEFLLSVRPSSQPGMEFINMFWEEQFGCKLDLGSVRTTKNSADSPSNNKNTSIERQKSSLKLSADDEGVAAKPACTGLEDLSLSPSSYTDVSQVRISYNVYKAVYAIAHALHTLLNCGSTGPDKGMCEKHKHFTSKQLLHHLRTVNFTNQFEEKVYFDSNGEPVPLYDIINWQKDDKGGIRFIKVGSYDGSAGQQLQIKQDIITWTGGQFFSALAGFWVHLPFHFGIRPTKPQLEKGELGPATAQDSCLFLGEEQRNSLFADGDVVIGGFSSRALRWMQTMTFAIKEINQRRDLLPHLRLGYHIHDSGDDIPVSLRSSFLLVNGQPKRGLGAESVSNNQSVKKGNSLTCGAVERTVSSVIIGDAGSGVSMALLRSLGSFHIPLMSSAKVIINFSGESEMQSILRETRLRNITGLQWIASEAWATARSLWEKSGHLLMGTLGFAIQRAAMIPGLQQHLTNLTPSSIQNQAYFAEFWEETFKCQLNGSMDSKPSGVENHSNRVPCEGSEDLKHVYSPYSDVTQLRVSYNVYKAVYLVAHALQDMSNCITGAGPFLNGTCADSKHFQPWQLIYYMKRANFSALGEKVNFDQNGDPIAYYDLMNWQKRPDGSLHLVKVGFYDASLPADSLECSRCSEDTWPNKDRNICIPKAIEYLSFDEPMGFL